MASEWVGIKMNVTKCCCFVLFVPSLYFKCIQCTSMQNWKFLKESFSAMVDTKRKGAARISDVSPEILAQLEDGTIESATLSEGLALSFSNLLGCVFPALAGTAAEMIDPKAGITKRMATAAALIVKANGQGAAEKLATHPSDTVRGWAAFAIASDANKSLAQKLEHLQPLADDGHFGVREWTWLAVRPDIVAQPVEAIAILQSWITSPSEYIRRFAVEATRPRGVWSAHIGELKSNPDLGLPLLAPLKSDPSRYVQDSVANWLNDAYKSQPDWVIDLCARWQDASGTKETAYIVKRGLRSRKA